MVIMQHTTVIGLQPFWNWEGTVAFLEVHCNLSSVFMCLINIFCLSSFLQAEADSSAAINLDKKVTSTLSDLLVIYDFPTFFFPLMLRPLEGSLVSY